MPEILDIVNLRDITDIGDRPPAGRGGGASLAQTIGGSVRGEHGIGGLRREWAGRELGLGVVALRRAVRRLLDPQGILNPALAL